MKIKSLNKDYIQKSRLFLYPLLGIKRGVSVTPVQTYMSWKDKYCFTDSKLVCKYYLREDTDFKVFEEVKLLGNPFFHAFYPLDEDTGVYVFDLSSLGEDFWKVTRGEYSQLSNVSKENIRSFFKSNTQHYGFIQSYLDPKSYHAMYKEMLNCKIEALKTAHELCSKPDLDLETLETEIKIMTRENNPLNLPPQTNKELL